MNKLYRNPILLTDAYNVSHQAMKINVDWETSHVYNRNAGQILFGFHELVTDFLGNTNVTHDMIDEAIEVSRRFGLVFPEKLFRSLVDDLGGKISLKVECLPEGTYCPAGTPFAQISNTVEGYGELVTWWEAIFLHAYFPSACATEAMHMRQYLESVRRENGYDEKFLWRFHSFGFRGHRSVQDAYQAGSAWALFLHGTDDIHIGLHRPEADLGSIPALAHKVVQQFDDEYDAFVRAIDSTAEQGLNAVALVIDTYSAYNVIDRYTVRLAKHAEKLGVHIVLRPDSGDTYKQVVDIYDIVREHGLTNVSAIVGEGMSFEECKRADLFFQQNNVPLTFVSYGIGSGFYNSLKRDTLGWAMKTAFSNGKNRMKFSNDSLKRSIPGKVRVFRNDVGEMCVGTREEVADHDSLYKIIYHYDGDEGRRVCAPDSFSDAQRRALVSMDHTSQKYIKSTPAIKALVKEFKDRYLKK